MYRGYDPGYLEFRQKITDQACINHYNQRFYELRVKVLIDFLYSYISEEDMFNVIEGLMTDYKEEDNNRYTILRSVDQKGLSILIEPK